MFIGGPLTIYGLTNCKIALDKAEDFKMLEKFCRYINFLIIKFIQVKQREREREGKREAETYT